MSPEQFDHLLSMVEPLITKEDTNYRKSISLAERVALTIRLLLAAGQSQISLSLSFRIGKSTISKIIVETWDVLHRLLFPMSSHHRQTTSGMQYPKILRNSRICFM